MSFHISLSYYEQFFSSCFLFQLLLHLCNFQRHLLRSIHDRLINMLHTYDFLLSFYFWAFSPELSVLFLDMLLIPFSMNRPIGQFFHRVAMSVYGSEVCSSVCSYVFLFLFFFLPLLVFFFMYMVSYQRTTITNNLGKYPEPKFECLHNLRKNKILI